jgi:hypothetical protein
VHAILVLCFGRSCGGQLEGAQPQASEANIDQILAHLATFDG